MSLTAQKWHHYENFMSSMFKLSDKINIIKVTHDHYRYHDIGVSLMMIFVCINRKEFSFRRSVTNRL